LATASCVTMKSSSADRIDLEVWLPSHQTCTGVPIIAFLREQNGDPKSSFGAKINAERALGIRDAAARSRAGELVIAYATQYLATAPGMAADRRRRCSGRAPAAPLKQICLPSQLTRQFYQPEPVQS
jgi:hypothetical protein